MHGLEGKYSSPRHWEGGRHSLGLFEWF